MTNEEQARAFRMVRVELTVNAVRWANNMLTEVLSNHGSVLPEETRRFLSDAVRALRSAQGSVR